MVVMRSSSDELPNPFDNSEPQPYAEKFKARKAYTEFADPCEHAAKASMECLNRNDYRRSKCLGYFEAYRDCKKAWLDQRKADRRAGKEASLA